MTPEAPYTPQTVIAIRKMANAGMPIGAVATELGWDEQRLKRLARQHDIEFLPPAIPSSAKPAPQVVLRNPKTRCKYLTVALPEEVHAYIVREAHDRNKPIARVVGDIVVDACQKAERR